ncbi:MAG: hypothetical protein ACE5R6_11055 [Candidatus Heimdallarchaeota archaeon]
MRSHIDPEVSEAGWPLHLELLYHPVLTRSEYELRLLWRVAIDTEALGSQRLGMLPELI